MSSESNAEPPHLIEWLRKIQLAWDLSPVELSRISHAEEADLKRYLALSNTEVLSLPTIPSGLEAAVGLVGLYRQLLTVYPSREEQLKWLELPNQVLEGRRPLEVMAMSPAHLAYVTYAVESGLRLGPRKE